MQGYVQQLFNIERLIYWLFTVDLSKFKLSWFFSIIVNDEFSICPGMGYEHDKVEMLFSTKLRIAQGYKKMITDLCDFSGAWTGFEAKYFDKIEQSVDVDIPLNKWKFYTEQRDQILFGTAFPSSAFYCKPLPGIGTKVTSAGQDGFIDLVDSFARNAYTKLGAYYWDNYGREIAGETPT